MPAMSDPRIDAISAALGGAPEDLIQRSAEARAAAQGASVDDVLGAWSGGGELAAAAPAAAPEADTAPITSAAPVDAAPATPAAAPAAVALAVAPPVVEDDEPDVEPAGLRERIRVGAKIGALVGGLLGFVALVVTMPALLNRLGLPAGESTPAIEVTPLAAVLVIAALSAAFGAVVTLTARGVGGFISPALATASSARSSVMTGVLNGLVLGFVAGGTVIGRAETTLSSTKLLPVRSTVFTILIGGVVLGALAGALAQAFAQPAALRGEAADDAEVIRRRISDSMGIPLVSSIIILLVVVPFGTLLVEYPAFAPWLAMLVSIGILAFASLMASRPNLKITRGEVVTAAVGVGVILLAIALIASETSGGGHGEAEDTHSHSIIIG